MVKLMLSDKSIQKFTNIYKRTFGEDLSDAEASRKATSILQIYLAVYGQPFENTNTQQTDATATDK